LLERPFGATRAIERHETGSTDVPRTVPCAIGLNDCLVGGSWPYRPGPVYVVCVARTDAFTEAVTALGRLRGQVNDEITNGSWSSNSHAEVEALGFVMLAVGAVESVQILARANVATVVAGTAAARAAYEAVVTCTWMLAPSDPFERDRRWMALFHDERAYWTRMALEAKTRNDTDQVIDAMDAEVTRIQRIIDKVQPNFDARGLPPMRRLPTLDDQLNEIGERGTYVLYKTACQLVHPTIRALSQVRDMPASHSGEADAALYQWRTEPGDWAIALLLAIHALSLGMNTVGQQLGAGKQLSMEFRVLHDAAVNATRTMAESESPRID